MFCHFLPRRSDQAPSGYNPLSGRVDRSGPLSLLPSRHPNMGLRVRNILGIEPHFQANSLSRLVQLFVRQETVLGARTEDTNWEKPLQLRFPTAVVQLQLAQSPHA